MSPRYWLGLPWLLTYYLLRSLGKGFLWLAGLVVGD